MDHAVRLADVGLGDGRGSALGVGDGPLAAAGVLDHQLLALDRGQGGGAAALLSLGGDVGGGQASGHDMIGQDFSQGRLLGGLHQTFARGRRDFLEGRVIGREDSEGAGTLQGGGQAGRLNRGDQGRQVRRLGGVGDDVVGRVHGHAADHGLGGDGRHRGGFGGRGFGRGLLNLGFIIAAGDQRQHGGGGYGDEAGGTDHLHGVSPSTAARRGGGSGRTTGEQAKWFKLSGAARDHD
ncbi:hypothetical protein D3C72_1677120 [compost metagenome]